MKSALKSIVVFLLALLVRFIVRKYKPTVIMVTGSVGKTSTKDAIAAALRERTFVRASEKSHNTQFGVPLTVIGARNPWNSGIGWVRVMREALALIVLPNHYPNVLVLEVGADRPGDLAKTLRTITPDAVVVTRLPEVPVHVEAYTSPEAVREEEFVPAYGLAPGAPLIIASDDQYARMYASRLRASVTTFGFDEDADARIKDEHVHIEENAARGMAAKLAYRDEEHEIAVQGSLGKQQLLAVAAACAVSCALGFGFKDVVAGLKSYAPPPGRSRLLRGKNESTLIDDSYNASPAAVKEALAALCLIPHERRIVVLGDMLELGRYSVEEHERIGTEAAACADVIVTVGIRARKIAEAARKTGFAEDRIYSLDSSEAAAAMLSDFIQKGDVVLIKGSQSIRTERVVKALLADPDDASKLVRQEKEWQIR